jgi:prepilin peptidase CpaA
MHGIYWNVIFRGSIAIEIKLLVISILLLLAVMSDLASYKIKNSLTFSFMLTGMLMNLIRSGTKGVVFSLQGIILPVICLLVLYTMRMLGAGDIKLLSAIGSVMGSGFTANVMIFSFICGGIMAAGLILTRHNGIERVKYLCLYIKSCLISMKLLQYSDFRYKPDGSKFPFSVAVASGTAAAVIIGRLGGV